MIKRLLCITIIVMVVALASAPAFAFYVNVLSSRAVGGAINSPNFTMSGLATSSGKSTAAPLAGWTGGSLVGTGSYYAGDTTPVKWGDWSFNPTTTGYYDVYGTWSNVTVTQNMPPIWTINYAGGSSTASPTQVTGGNAWNLLASGKTMNAGTGYTAHLATPGTGASGKRASFDSVAWAASAADQANYTGPGNGQVGDVEDFMELSWTAGAKTMLFDVYFGTTSGGLTQVGSDLTVDMLAFDLVGTLVADETYYWRVDSQNIDRVTTGAEWSFTTNPVPEPSSMLAFATGLIGLFGIVRRKKA